MTPRRVAAIVDTNVILDVFAVSDLLDAYAKAGGESDAALFRRVRARESHLLAWYLHSIGATTFSLPAESTRIMARRAPPDAMNTFASQHVQLSIYFLSDYVLDRWDSRVEPGSDAGLSGEACDDKLVEMALRHRAPLITNEGYSIRGVSADEPRKLRAKASARGVPVFTPRQFWMGKMGERATRKFLARFDAQAPKYLRGQGNSVAAQNAVRMRRALLHHVFFGATANGGRVPVRLHIDLG